MKECNLSLASAGGSVAVTELPEPLQAAKGDQAGVVGVFPQLELLATQLAVRIAVKAKGKIFLMEIGGIMAIHAEGNYVLLNYRSTAYLLREPLCSIAVKLKPYHFIQIHRSVLVNASLVDEIWPLATGEYRIRVRSGKEYVVTRKYLDNLRHLAYVWLGSERFVGQRRY
jgi:DNA-binding LytR/AlgR family response regulator